MDRILLVDAIARRWWLVLLLGLAGAAVAYASYVNAPKRYQSVVVMQLNPSATSGYVPYGSSGTSSDQSTNTLANLAASYREVLKSRSFGVVVVQRLQLPVTPEAVVDATNAVLTPGTNLFRITVTWDNPIDAQALAQNIAEIFIKESLPQHQTQVGVQERLAQLDSASQSVQRSLPGLRQQRDRLDQAVARGDLSQMTDLNDLNTRLTAMESAYANVVAEISRARSSLDTASILEGATLGRNTESLPLPQAVLLGLAGGAALACVLAIFIEFLRDVVRTPEDVVELSGNAPLAAISNIPRPGVGWRKKAATPLLLLRAPHAPAAEAFRILRTNLAFATSGKSIRSIIVTSAGPAEGKSLVASNLALALAQAGQLVLLVDGDIRRPTMHTALGVENRVGLVDALTRLKDHPDEELDPTMVPGARSTGSDGLWILPAGHHTSNPSELLTRAGALIERLTQVWDIVIIDTPPVGPVADAQLLASAADGMIVVARSGQTHRTGLRGTLEALQTAGPPLLGVVLNDFRPGALSRYRTYGYYYSGYYGKYYSNGVDTAVENGHHENGVDHPRLSLNGRTVADKSAPGRKRP